MNDIGWAVQHLKSGSRVSRMGWNNGNPSQRPFLELHQYGAGAMQEGYVYIRTEMSDRQPWTCHQPDLLATDWEVLLK